jgi:hypothetical protein
MSHFNQKGVFMTRNMDLVRTILLDVEKRKPACGTWEFEPFLEGKDTTTVVEHLNLLINEGLLTGTASYIPESDFSEVSDINITWKGYEFLSLSRDDSIWKIAKDKILKELGSIPISLLMEYMKNLAKSKLGL